MFREKVAEKFVPVRTVISSNQEPWFNKSLKRLRNKKKRLFRSAKISNSKTRWDSYRAAATQYKEALKDAKHRFFIKTLLNMLMNKPKQLWNIVNKRTKKLKYKKSLKKAQKD